jgi:hypothetical protein
MLVSGALDQATTRTVADAIDRNAKTLAKLIEDILDVSKALSGKMPLDIDTTDLKAVAEAAILNVRRAADAKGVTLRLEIDPAIEPVPADATRLQQVVWNLLSNAVKFTPSGGRVTLAIRRDAHGVVLEVIDSGIGISADFLPYVFDRFRQADSSATRALGGLGLGLSIVRHVVLAHGGTVEAFSAGLGLGSTFRISLPGTATALPTAGARQHQGDRPHRLEAVSVLVLDDHADSRQLFSQWLSQQGASVRAVDSVAGAREAMELKEPDVLVSDLALPGEDGFALMAELRSRGRIIPAIAVTGFTSPADRARTRAAGFQRHLSKPVDQDSLVAAVAELCLEPRPLETTAASILSRSP